MLKSEKPSSNFLAVTILILHKVKIDRVEIMTDKVIVAISLVHYKKM
jgi:hypothetical protein